MRKLLILVLVALVVGLTVVVSAQDTTLPDSVVIETSSGVEIAWPQPVSEVWGSVPVLGSADIPNMSTYFIEAIALNDDLSIPLNAPWLPLTPGFAQPVTNDFLATIDTTEAQDGLYAIRLTVNTTDGQQFTDVVSPVRLNNTRYAIEVALIKERYGIEVEPTATPEPTTAPGDTTARVMAAPPNPSVNMRRCDLVDNDRCPILDRLTGSEEGRVLAISSNGTGWFQVRRSTGSVGWVSPTVVTTLGDFTNLPRVAPPPPLAPPAPPTAANITINGLAIQGTAVCNEQFTVHVNVANTGSATARAGSVTLQNVHIRTGSVTTTGFGSYPDLAPGANFVVVIPMRVSVFFNEEHELRAFTSGVQFNTRYILQQGSCGVTANPTPVPEPTRPPLTVVFAPGECTLTINNGVPTFLFPNGGQVGQIFGSATFEALRGSNVNSVAWYEIRDARLDTNVWVRGVDTITSPGCALPSTF
jgi:hypothetical protein